MLLSVLFMTISREYTAAAGRGTGTLPFSDAAYGKNDA